MQSVNARGKRRRGYPHHRREGRDTLEKITLAAVEQARRTLSGRILRTPLLPAPRLSALTGAEVFIKYENLQVTGSFKERGAVA